MTIASVTTETKLALPVAALSQRGDATSGGFYFTSFFGSGLSMQGAAGQVLARQGREWLCAAWQGKYEFRRAENSLSNL